MNWISAIGRMFARDHTQQTSWAWVDRQLAYAVWDAYYDNVIYEAYASGGQREEINRALGNAAAADLAGLYNPVAAVVDLYLHVFDGAFGDEIQIELEQQATEAFRSAVEQVWTWSNLTVKKQTLCRLAATHGAVGLRIVARDDLNPAKQRVYIKPEHPKIIRDVELDDRGNVEAIQLEYELTSGLAEQAVTLTIREELTKESISTWRVEGSALIPYDLEAGRDNGPRAAYPNALGVVPYVLLQHQDSGTAWGKNAFYRQRQPIDRLNALMCHVDIQIHRHVKVKWFIAASGAAPVEIDLSDSTVAYVDTRGGSQTPPVMEPMIASLDLSGAIEQAKLQIQLIEDQLPELKATQGRFLAGQSGETIAELRKPAEDKIGLARANYEDALTRAQQIAVSWMVMLGMADIGTGSGSREAAQQAYDEGYESHRFNKRPLLETEPASQSASQQAPPPPPPPGQEAEEEEEEEEVELTGAAAASQNGREPAG